MARRHIPLLCRLRETAQFTPSPVFDGDRTDTVTFICVRQCLPVSCTRFEPAWARYGAFSMCSLTMHKRAHLVPGSKTSWIARGLGLSEKEAAELLLERFKTGMESALISRFGAFMINKCTNIKEGVSFSWTCLVQCDRRRLSMIGDVEDEFARSVLFNEQVQ